MAGVFLGASEEIYFDSALDMRRFAHQNSADLKGLSTEIPKFTMREIFAKKKVLLDKMIWHIFDLASQRELADSMQLLTSKCNQVCCLVDFYQEYCLKHELGAFDFKFFLNSKKSRGFTAMQMAHAYRNLDAMLVFLKWGADFELETMGYPLFWFAIQKLNKPLARMVLDKISTYFLEPHLDPLFRRIGPAGVRKKIKLCIFNLEEACFSEALLNFIRTRNLEALKCFCEYFLEENRDSLTGSSVSLLASVFSKEELLKCKLNFLETLMAHGLWGFIDECLQKMAYQSPVIFGGSSGSGSSVLSILRVKALEPVTREEEGAVLQRTLWDYAVVRSYHALLFYLLAFDLISNADWDQALLMDETDVGRRRLLKLAKFLCVHESFFSEEESDSGVLAGMELSLLRSKIITAGVCVSEWTVLNQLFLTPSARTKSLDVFKKSDAWLYQMLQSKMGRLEGAEHLLIQAVDQEWSGLACFLLDYFKEKISSEVLLQAQCRDGEKGDGFFAYLFRRNSALKIYCETRIASFLASPAFVGMGRMLQVRSGGELVGELAGELRGASRVYTSFVVRDVYVRSTDSDAPADSDADSYAHLHSH